jgi:transcriptional regulator with XRE-family HTH domain
LHEKNLRASEVERRSKRGGRKGITRGYVIQIKNGQSLNPSRDKLQALADGLGVAVSELLTCALGQKLEPQDRFAVISMKFEKLPPNLKAKAEPLIEVLEREIERLGLE